MNAVERLGSYITRGVYTVAGPFHPFGGAVDIIVVEQQDGTFKSTPWYVKFGKFQGVLKRREKLVTVSVNGVEAEFHMFLDHKGEAYFLKEVDQDDDDGAQSAPSSGEDTEDGKRRKKGSCQSQDLDGRQRSELDEDPMNPARTVINENNGKLLMRTNSRRSRILGLVFGRRSMKGERRDSSGVDRIDSLERAEIAADLLEVKWSTNFSDRTKEGTATNSSSLSSTSPLTNGGNDPGLAKDKRVGENYDASALILENSAWVSPSLPQDDSIVGKNSELDLPGSGNSCSSLECSSVLSLPAEKETQGNDCVGIDKELEMSPPITESESSDEKEPKENGGNVLSTDGVSDVAREVNGAAPSSSNIAPSRNVAEEENCDVDFLELVTSGMKDPSSVLEDSSVGGMDDGMEFSVLQNSCLTLEASFPLPKSAGKEEQENDCSGISAEAQMSLMVIVSERVKSGAKESNEDRTCVTSMAENSKKESESEDDSLSSSPLEPEVEDANTRTCNDDVIEQEAAQKGWTDEVQLNAELFETTELVNEPTLSRNLVIQVEEKSENYLKMEQDGKDRCCSLDEHQIVTEKKHESSDFTLQSYGSDEMIDGNETENVLEYGSTHTGDMEVFQFDDISENENLATNVVVDVDTLDRASPMEMGKNSESQMEHLDDVCSTPDQFDNAEVTENFSDHGANLAYPSYPLSLKDKTSTESISSGQGGHEADNNELETDNDVTVLTSVASSLNSINVSLAASCSGHVASCQLLEDKLLTDISSFPNDKADVPAWPSQDAAVDGEMITCATNGTLEKTSELERMHHESSLSSELIFESTTEDDIQESSCDCYHMTPVEAMERSKPISILKPLKHERDAGPFSKSLPILRSGISDLESFGIHTLSHSLTSNYELLKMGILVKDFESPSEDRVASKVEMETEQNKPEGDTSVCETQSGSESQRPPVDNVVEISLCKHLLSEGMGIEAASKAFDSEKVSFEKFSALGPSILKNDRLVVRINGQYFPWDAAAPIVLGMVSFGHEKTLEPKGMIAVERIEKKLEKYPSSAIVPSGGSWRFWPFGFNKSKSLTATRSLPSDCLGDSGEKSLEKQLSAAGREDMNTRSTKKVRTIIPTSQQLASLNLKEGQNIVTFTFSTAMLGKQQVDARIYLWKWNTRIVISDVDGTITKSDVLGQFMPLVGKDWSHLGVAHLYSAIKVSVFHALPQAVLFNSTGIFVLVMDVTPNRSRPRIVHL
ncbi:Phosphatidate phosphatase [Nymphaea thermarum]|nr:Phosphatidate phosphatase [Nymphaea thermarum]